jgi:hypothetical protein
MRNERTPRTLAETQFHTGYPLAVQRRQWRTADWVMYALAVAVLVGIAVGVL